MGNMDELIAKLAGNAPRVKLAPHPFSLGVKWMGAAAAYLALLLAFSGLCPNLGSKLHEPWFIAEMFALAGVFIATSASAAVLAFPDLHQMRRVAFAPVIAFALFGLVMFLAWRADNPPAALPAHRFECTLSIIGVALLPAGWTFYSLRRFASTHYHWTGMVALFSAFSVGALWLRLHETNDSIMHVVQWHYLPMIAFGIAGLWIGKVLLKW